MWSIFKYENDFVAITKEEINGIPCLKFRPKVSRIVLPTVIYYHGWHSSKDFKRFEALILASHGYQVIVPDALHHGEREPIDHDNPKNLVKYEWKIILHSVMESKNFIEQVINNHEASPNRIAILGSSMGAISAGAIFAMNTGLKCLIGLNGTFAWQEGIERGDLVPANKDNKKLIEEYDPLNNGDKFKERAILMIHSTEDTSVSIENQRIFYNSMLPKYVEYPERIRLLEANKVNHHITTGMLEKVVIWLKENL